jgi:hypothetical protein
VFLAHGGGGGGNSGWVVPALLVGAAIVGAGLARRGKEGVGRWTAPALVVLGVVVAVGGILYSSRGTSRPDVHIVVIEPAAGATVPADTPVKVRVAVDTELATGPEDRSGGHLHLAVDGKLEQMPYGTELEVRLPPGRHVVTVEYVDNRHLSYKPKIEHTIELTAT